MNTIAVTTLLNSLVELIVEAYDGPVDPNATWFIDNQPDSGVLGLLKSVTALEASTSVDGSRKAGTTIAAHTEHLRWSLANVNNTIRGKPWNPNWNESWELLKVEDAEWDQLRQSLRSEFVSLCEGLKEQQSLPVEYMNGLIALIPHAAYHLATIRQMLERVRMPA